MKQKRLNAYSGTVLSSWSCLIVCDELVLYILSTKGKFHTLAGIFVVANVRIRDMLSSSYSVLCLFNRQK